MNKLKYIFSLLFIFIVTACHDDMESVSTSKSVHTTMSISLEIPLNKKVTFGRAVEDYESEVNEVMLFLFSNNNQYSIPLTSKLGGSEIIENGGRRYQLVNADAVPIMTGNYRVYAVANWSSKFCNVDIDENTTENELQSILATKTGEIYDVSGTDRFPMSFYQEVSISENASENNLQISLKRITSHIEFTFANGNGTHHPKFIPLTYSIYNLPLKANVINKSDNKLGEDIGGYENVYNIPVVNNTIKFFMLENVQAAADECSDYSLRDKWSGEPGASPAEKNFIYAPENSTYVVVKGEYEDDNLRGNVSYTIHLGNFNTNNGGSYDNFTVNRNEYHTYNVTVNGVDEIVTEAQIEQPDGGNNPGAEGDLTQKHNVFVLDAHYETVMLKIETSKLVNTKTAVVNTPYGKKELSFNGNKPSDNDDWKWVEFKRPTNTNEFPKWAGDGRGDLHDLLNAPDDYCLEYNGYYYTTAFVNEYFYENETDLTKFINVDNRELILYDPEAVSKSEDGNSIYREGIIFSITQRSIKSTYDLTNTDEDYNPFGIETWDEFDPLPWGTTANSLDRSAGYANTVKLQNSNDNDDIDFTQIGYLEAVVSNTKAAHNWGAESAVSNNAVLAALSRNRDTNGDGKITGDELKWYIPSIHNYQTIWLGQDLLKDDTRLYDETLLPELTADGMDHQAHLYTSSADGQRLYWHEQGACYSETANWNTITVNGKSVNYNNVRCIRNLKKVNGEATLPVSRDGNVINVTGVKNVRNYSITELYGKHYERDDENLLPTSFEVAEPTQPTYYGTKYYNVGLSGVDEATINASINSFSSNKTGWRVPNQRELMLMDMCGFLPNEGVSGARYSFVSSTWFSGTKTGRNIPFVFDSADYGQNNANIALPSGGVNGNAVVLFVRDNI